MKAPKYFGPKKDHSAIWVTECDRNRCSLHQTCVNDRFRIRDSKGEWFWTHMGYLGQEELIPHPCWFKPGTTDEKAQKAMNNYDNYDESSYRTTYFLGYVRDTE